MNFDLWRSHVPLATDAHEEVAVSSADRLCSSRSSQHVVGVAGPFGVAIT